MQFISEDLGWLAKGKSVWRSSDGGKNWELIYRGEPSWEAFAAISNMQFINPKSGWMTIAPEGIYKTEDGGGTWKRKPDPIPDLVYESLYFSRDGTRVWVAGTVLKPPPQEYAGMTPREDSYPVILSTSNGGKTWNKQIVPNTRGIFSFIFPGENQGWALGHPGLFRLDNSKGAWKEVDFAKGGCRQLGLIEAVEIENPSKQAALYFSNLEVGWLAFTNGYVAKTTDGGKTWCDLLNPKDIWPEVSWDSYFQKIHLSNSGSGWGLGADGSLYRSTDGGKKWHNIRAEKDLTDLFFLNDKNGWVLSSDTLYKIAH